MANTEFTSRLRIAIKTKIQELGIEADDELPDYIMLMIANKKDKVKMKNDLMLFLSENTDNFVDWLFDFFDKVNKKESINELKKETEKPKRIRKHSEDKARSRSRSPRRSRTRSRSRSPRRKHDEEKSKRQPIRAPSPSRKNRRRSRSLEKERKSRREDRKKITYSDSDDDGRRVRSAVISNRHERTTPPKVSSQVVVKKRKADHGDELAASSLFKRAVTETLRDDAPRRKVARNAADILEVNTAKSSKRTILVEDLTDISDEEEPETQFIVRMNKKAALRKSLKAEKLKKAIMENADDVTLKKKRRAEDPGQNALWDGKISVDDDEELSGESDHDEAEIDQFLADSMIPPTVSLSRPVMPVPAKKQYGAGAVKPPEIGKIPERCKFYPNCRNEAICMYSHPSKPCINFPQCWFGDKCLFIHPKCKFEPNCTKPNCPYMHTMPRTLPTKTLSAKQPNILPITNPEKNGENAETSNNNLNENNEAKENKEGTEEKTVTEGNEKVEKENEEKQKSENDEENDDDKTEGNEKSEENSGESTDKTTSESKPDIPLQEGIATAAALAPKIKPIVTTNISIPCRFGARCHSELCAFRHPKKCRYDEACANEQCYFWHPKKNAGRFKWTKT